MSAKGTCRFCHGSILWGRTAANGRAMPLDPVPNPAGNAEAVAVDTDGLVLVKVIGPNDAPNPDRTHYTTHFETCPDRPQRGRAGRDAGSNR